MKTAILEAYTQYDSDPRVNGIHDIDAFRAAIEREFSRLIVCEVEFVYEVLRVRLTDEQRLVLGRELVGDVEGRQSQDG